MISRNFWEKIARVNFLNFQTVQRWWPYVWGLSLCKKRENFVKFWMKNSKHGRCNFFYFLFKIHSFTAMPASFLFPNDLFKMLRCQKVWRLMNELLSCKEVENWENPALLENLVNYRVFHLKNHKIEIALKRLSNAFGSKLHLW